MFDHFYVQALCAACPGPLQSVGSAAAVGEQRDMGPNAGTGARGLVGPTGMVNFIIPTDELSIIFRARSTTKQL